MEIVSTFPIEGIVMIVFREAIVWFMNKKSALDTDSPVNCQLISFYGYDDWEGAKKTTVKSIWMP